ncbi:MAG TPA: DUF5666 domain-containing protein [Candidatus Acidoferrum sp.]|nr:DUF5666 domain-containing protein [Candidatus Acidoferrum sp.]
MLVRMRPLLSYVALFPAVCLGISISAAVPSLADATMHQTTAPPATQSPARPVGTIKSISGNTITLTTDAGTDVTVLVQDATKLLRIAPGQKDLKEAAPIALSDLQAGDRILVRGALAGDGKSVLAASVIVMKKADIADKQSREREDWQRHGTGGLVNSVDAAANTVTITLPAIGEKRNVTVHLSKDTVLRRYAADSVKFDDAKPAPIDQIKPGDQLRARGTRNPDGSELTAIEIVSGTFHNIAGTISALDASTNTLTVQDLTTKKPVTLKITSDSQLRKLSPLMAQRIAARLKGISTDAPPSAAASSPGSNAAQPARPSSAPANGPAGGPGGFGGAGRRGGSGTPDLQQAINRMPAATLADLQRGDAIMVVTTESGPNGVPSAIILLAGVEPILEASPKTTAGTILSPWSLGTAPGGEAAAP